MGTNVDECIKNCVDILKDYFNHKDCKCVTEYKNQKTSKMTHKIEIPEGCKANISQENGCLIIEVEPEFKQGDVLVINNDWNKWYFIPVDFNSVNDITFKFNALYSESYKKVKTIGFFVNRAKNTIKKATPEETEFFHSKLAEAGYKYNPETHKVEKLRWKPEIGEPYYTPFAGHCIWQGSEISNERYNLNAVFKTEAEAKEAEQKFAKLYE